MRSLIWFRADLRIDDNPALYHATRQADRGALAIFLVCPEQWREHDWGAPRVDFLLRNLAELSASLRRLNIPLRIERTPDFSSVPELLLDFAREQECNALFFNREYEVNERRRDRAVEDLFTESGLAVHAHHDQTVIEPGAIRTGQETFYTVYTPFRKAWEAWLEENGVPEPLAAPPKLKKQIGEPDEVPDRVPGFEPAVAVLDDWRPGEKAAHRLLERFVAERIERYDEQRDLAASDATSRLSPYLACGAISARRCLAAALEANRGRWSGGSKGIQVWIRELVWREFYRHVLVGYPRVSKNRAFREETEAVAWRRDEKGFKAWCEGRTGVPFVDAGMRQLAATGWMHNRLRMVTAMFLTKDLLIDWRRGERHFMRHLIDGDLANNNGGWQWSASTGTDAAPYFRIFNPWTQGRRYDPEGEFIHAWVPELREVEPARLHDPEKLAELDLKRLGYPEPLVDHRSARMRAVAAFEKAKG